MSAPCVGFLGTGWIGRHRMAAMQNSGAIEVAAVVDPSDECARLALEIAPGAQRLPDLDALLGAGLDGLVIATPSALHAEQAIAALDQGLAVFCQKPLGRTAAEAQAVVAAAERADRLLSVDFSYRFTAAARAIRGLVESGTLGDVFAIDLRFHNAYGPDKGWFRDRALSGGGCVIDLGVHLIDLALWLTGFPAVTSVAAQLHAQGIRLARQPDRVEDHAAVQITLECGATVTLACSWNLPAGRDAVIALDIYGTQGGASLHNPGGGFYDFEAWHHRGTASERVAAPPDDWGGRAAAAWARRLQVDAGWAGGGDELIRVAETIDRIYGRSLPT